MMASVGWSSPTEQREEQDTTTRCAALGRKESRGKLSEDSRWKGQGIPAAWGGSDYLQVDAMNTTAPPPMSRPLARWYELVHTKISKSSSHHAGGGVSIAAIRDVTETIHARKMAGAARCPRGDGDCSKKGIHCINLPGVRRRASSS